MIRNRSLLKSSAVRTAAVAAASAIALGMGLAPAHAATATFHYDAEGISHIGATDSTIDLGPTTLKVDLDSSSGEFTGELDLPETRTSFNAAGFLPTTATVSFESAAPVSGQLHRATSNSPTMVTSEAAYVVRLSDIKVLGFPTFTGPNCRTKDPVVIPADTPEGEAFDLTDGGRLTGTYSIGKFENCGLNTWLINLLIPGSGNTAELNVSNGRYVPPS